MIKVTKCEYYNVVADYLNATISEDLYKQDDELEIIMSINLNATGEKLECKHFANKDDAIEYFVELEEEVKIENHLSSQSLH
tara:strand:- start:336 stop:581 length:246 start_codon:yes stop_codon:yes gene_type:complete